MRTSLLSASLFILGACASGGMSTGRSFGVGRSPIYAEEIRSTPMLTAYDAVQRLRPMYFTMRGPATVLSVGDTRLQVFLNDMWIGGVDTLRGIPASEIAWIRYLSPSEATLRFGTRAGAGAIVVWVGK